MPPARALALLALAVLNLVLLLLMLVGGIVLLGWGTRLALRTPGSRLLRGAWPLLFFFLPGIGQLLFSLAAPTPGRFRLLAAGVSLSLAAVIVLTAALFALEAARPAAS